MRMSLRFLGLVMALAFLNVAFKCVLHPTSKVGGEDGLVSSGGSSSASSPSPIERRIAGWYSNNLNLVFHIYDNFTYDAFDCKGTGVLALGGAAGESFTITLTATGVKITTSGSGPMEGVWDEANQTIDFTITQALKRVADEAAAKASCP